MAAYLLILLLCLLGIAAAAPTYPAKSVNQLATLNSLYVELMENVCNDLTLKACVDRDGYMFRYSVFDPVSHFCVCSAAPSPFMVSRVAC
jgi:hypothetical protein